MDAKTTAAAEKVMRARPPLTLALQAHLTLEQKKNVRKKQWNCWKGRERSRTDE